MMKSFYFWGLYDENEGDPVWQTLHDHFEKLAREDGSGVKKMETTEGKAAKRK